MRKCDFGSIGFFFRLDGSVPKRHLRHKLPCGVLLCTSQSVLVLSYQPGFLTHTLACTIVTGLCKCQTNCKEKEEDYSGQRNKTQQQEQQHSIVGKTEILGSVTAALPLISSCFYYYHHHYY